MIIIRIGRNPDNDIVYGSDLVSRYHCDIVKDDYGQYAITDHSTSGTLVNGIRLFHSSTYVHFGASVILPDFSRLDWNLVDSIIRRKSYQEDYSGRSQSYETYGSRGRVKEGMGFVDTLSYFFDHYADFDGRARRQEYWYMVLWSLIFLPVAPIWFVISFIPNIALMVRRLHDQGLSGWLVLLGLVPVFGAIFLFAATLVDSQPYSNEWGPSPKYFDRYSGR